MVNNRASCPRLSGRVGVALDVSSPANAGISQNVPTATLDEPNATGFSSSTSARFVSNCHPLPADRTRPISQRTARRPRAMGSKQAEQGGVAPAAMDPAEGQEHLLGVSAEFDPLRTTVIASLRGRVQAGQPGVPDGDPVLTLHFACPCARLASGYLRQHHSLLRPGGIYAGQQHADEQPVGCAAPVSR
jgi:hypothetical protein